MHTEFTIEDRTYTVTTEAWEEENGEDRTWTVNTEVWEKKEEKDALVETHGRGCGIAEGVFYHESSGLRGVEAAHDDIVERLKCMVEEDVFSLNWSVRVANILLREGIKTLGQLAAVPTETMCSWRNAGEKVVDEIQRNLLPKGFFLHRGS